MHFQENGEGTFHDAVIKKCKNYYDLLPIFEDRVTFHGETNENMAERWML